MRASVQVIGAERRLDVEVPRTGLRVGRAPDCEIQLTSSTVSKHHAEIFWVGDDLFVRDVGSCNGTRRDGMAITDAVLVKNDDELVLGGAVVLHVNISGAGFGAPMATLDDHSALVPTAATAGVGRRVDLLSTMTRLYQATSYEELGFQLSRGVAEAVGASRVALLELDGERIRALGLYKDIPHDPRPLTDAHFVSRTVIEAARKHRVAHFRDGLEQNLAQSVILSGAHSAAAAAIPATDGRERILYVDCVMGRAPLDAAQVQALELLARHAAGAFDAFRARLDSAHGRMRFEQLRRYFSPAVVEHIVDRGEVVEQPHMVDGVVLFADLVGYTKLSERLKDQPERLMSLLNRWLDAGAQAVFNQGGTLDKFIGDCVMAVFGAPLPQENAELLALRCAFEMRDAVARVAFEEGEPLQITVGINAGDMLAGSVGSKRRLEYTVLGDTVNVASRLQGKATPGDILVGPSIVQRVGNAAVFDDAGLLTLKNHGPVQAHRVISLGPQAQGSGE